MRTLLANRKGQNPEHAHLMRRGFKNPAREDARPAEASLFEMPDFPGKIMQKNF